MNIDKMSLLYPMFVMLVFINSEMQCIKALLNFYSLYKLWGLQKECVPIFDALWIFLKKFIFQTIQFNFSALLFLAYCILSIYLYR